MVKEIKPEAKRKTYSLNQDLAHELARHALDLSKELGKTIGRQAILDALVTCLNDKQTYTKVRNILKKS